MWPQIILPILMLLNIGLALGKHGQARTWSFWKELIDNFVLFALLWFGGFFEG